MLAQSLQSWKSWESWLRLVEIDTVDFLFGRLIYTCICTGENSEFTPPCGILRSCPMKESSKCRFKFCCNSPQILQIRIFSASFYFTYLGTKVSLILSLSISQFQFFIFSLSFLLSNLYLFNIFEKRLSLFYWNEKSQSFCETSFSLSARGDEQGYSYYIIYDSLLVFHRR